MPTTQRNPGEFVDPVSPEEPVIATFGFTPMGCFEEEDVFVCGWPKSGNTWCQRLFSGLVWGLDTASLTDQLAQFLQPDVHFKSFYRRFRTPTLFKSHCPPQADYRKVIFLVRDGRDAMVSYWRMLKQADPNLRLEDVFDQGDSLFPCAWETFARLWLSNPFQAAMITVRYEDLLVQPLEELRKVGKFIGSTRADADLEKIVSGASIQSMRRLSEEFGFFNNGSPLNNRFFANGRAGAYLTEMSRDLQIRFRHRAGDMLEHFGYPV
jgi:hypothetical protein